MTLLNDTVALADIIRTPSSLGAYLAPQLWGPGATFQVDPWLRLVEGEALSAVLDTEHERFLMVNVPPQSGKALALDTPIPTPEGWTTMGEVRVGDRVLGADGRACEVTMVSETQWKHPHTVTFLDGSTLVASPEHLWTTFDRRALSCFTSKGRRGVGRTDHDPRWWDWQSPTGKGPQVRSTEDIVDSLVDSDGVSNHSIPNTAPLELPDADLPIDPWLLGYRAGNGTRDNGTITTGSHNGDLDHPFVEEQLDKAGVEWTLRYRRDTSSCYGIYGLVTALKAIGGLRSKAIPMAYFRSSTRQRRALLAGLMDSDGTNGPTPGVVSFDSMDEHLVDAVCELFVSLGAHCHRATRRARLNGKDYGVCYRMSANPPFNPFTLPRKADLWKSGEVTGRSISRQHRYITGVEIGEELVPMRCIAVDSPGHLYLAGEQMVPTHNSSYVGEFLAFWLLGMFPETRIIFVSYSDDFSATRGARVRDMVKTWGQDLFGIQVDPDQASKAEWKLLGHRGGMLSVGIEGSLNGRPGDCLIIDDVIKDAASAASAADKRKHWNIYEGTIHARLQPGGTIILTATRWVEDDISGRIQTKMREPGYDGDQWKVLSIPAIAEPDEDEDFDPDWRDMLGRAEGEPLQTRFSKPGEAWHDNHFYRKKRTIDAFTFQSVYQQSPTMRTGGMFPFDDWSWYRPGTEPTMDAVVRVWDLAATAGGGDWTVGLKMGRAEDFYVLDVQRFRRGPADVQAAVKATAMADGFDVPVLIEQGKSGDGNAILDFYRQAIPLAMVRGMKPEGKKEQRAVPYSAMQNLGRVWLPTYGDLHDRKDALREAPDWVKQMVAEHKAFMGDGRTGRHDDTVDTAAYAVLDMLDAGPVEVVDSVRDNEGAWDRINAMTSN